MAGPTPPHAAEDVPLRPVPGLLWRRWEDGAVVYREDCGATHYLDPASAAVLILLCETSAPPATETLRAALRDERPDDGPRGEEREAQHLDRILTHLTRAGLLQRRATAEAVS